MKVITVTANIVVSSSLPDDHAEGLLESLFTHEEGLDLLDVEVTASHEVGQE